MAHNEKKEVRGLGSEGRLESGSTSVLRVSDPYAGAGRGTKRSTTVIFQGGGMFQEVQAWSPVV